MSAGAPPPCEISLIVGRDERLILACLDSLRPDHVAGLCHVVVTLNPGSDALAQRLRDCYGWVEIVRNGGQHGFAENHNVVLGRSRARYVWMLNDDTEIDAGALRSLTDYMDRHPSVGMCSPQLRNPDGTPQQTTYAAPTALSIAVWMLGLRPLLDWRIGTVSVGRLLGRIPLGRFRSSSFGPHRRGPVQRVKGAAMLVRTAALSDIGLMDEINRIFEEIEWQRRFWMTGWEIHLVTEAEIVHVGKVTTGVAPDRVLQQARQLVNDASKNLGSVSAAVVRASAVVAGAFYWLRGLLTRRDEHRALGRDLMKLGVDFDLDRHGRRYFAARGVPLRG